MAKGTSTTSCRRSTASWERSAGWSSSPSRSRTGRGTATSSAGGWRRSASRWPPSRRMRRGCGRSPKRRRSSPAAATPSGCSRRFRIQGCSICCASGPWPACPTWGAAPEPTSRHRPSAPPTTCRSSSPPRSPPWGSSPSRSIPTISIPIPPPPTWAKPASSESASPAYLRKRRTKRSGTSERPLTQATTKMPPRPAPTAGSSCKGAPWSSARLTGPSGRPSAENRRT